MGNTLRGDSCTVLCKTSVELRRRSRLCSLHDVSVAFYHALLDDDIWVDLPKGEEDEHGVVWQLKKTLYGTRRASLLFQEYVVQSGGDRIQSGACGSTDVLPRGMAGAGNCVR